MPITTNPAFLPPSPKAPSRLRHTPTCSTEAPPKTPLTPFSQVLITAPAPYATRLATSLIAANLRPIWAPTIRTDPLKSPSDIAAFQTALLNLPSHDVLAFTSRTGIAQVGSHLRQIANGNESLAADLIRQAGIRVAALGKDATASKSCLGVTADIIPLAASPQGLVDFLASDHSLAGSSVLCPVPLFTGLPTPAVVPNFLDALRKKGFEVTAVSAYETHSVDRDLLQRELKWLQHREIDAVAFSSAGEAFALTQMLTKEELDWFRGSVHDDKLILAAQGPFTADGVREALGIDRVHVNQDFGSFDGLVAALEHAFAERDRRDSRLVL